SHDLNLHVVTVTDYAIHFSENSIEFKNLIWHEDLSVELIFALQTIMNSKNIPFFKDMRGITRTSNHLNQADSANSTIESIEFAANQYPLLKVFPLRDEELNKLFLLLH
ncbi:MAG: hypothetical protein KDD40_04105, partial [Bdellovibrionales bacterium]|nr:hypothetical protein [Bdellovibrionales bacterium]